MDGIDKATVAEDRKSMSFKFADSQYGEMVYSIHVAEDLDELKRRVGVSRLAPAWNWHVSAVPER